MKAIGPQFTFSDAPIPVARENEALVRVHGFGVTTNDVNLRNVVPSSVLGIEFSGRIEEFGGKQHAEFRVGQAVYGLAVSGGAFAEYVVCPLDTLCPIPRGLSYSTAAAAASTWFFALQLLQHDAEMKKRDKILVYNAMSPIGQTTIELAQILGCRRVFAVVNSPVALTYVTRFLKFRTALPDEVIPLIDSPDLEKEVARYDSKGLDAVIDLRDVASMSQAIKLLAPDGRLAFTGAPQTLSMGDLSLVLYKRLRLHGVTFRARPSKFYKPYRDFIVKHINPKLLNGQLSIRLSRRYNWKDTKHAMELVRLAGENPGRVVCHIVPEF